MCRVFCYILMHHRFLWKQPCSMLTLTLNSFAESDHHGREGEVLRYVTFTRGVVLSTQTPILTLCMLCCQDGFAASCRQTRTPSDAHRSLPPTLAPISWRQTRSRSVDPNPDPTFSPSVPPPPIHTVTHRMHTHSPLTHRHIDTK